MDSSREELHQLLERAAQGNQDAMTDLIPLVYDQLRALAHNYVQIERRDLTLEPTALVHEAFMKLAGRTNPCWQNRAHLLAAAAIAMRQILTDHARRKKAAKRGGGLVRITLSGLSMPSNPYNDVELVALDNALEKLAARFPEQARVVELRFLGGLEVTEVADVLGVSKSTVERSWRLGRAWLRRELSGDAPS